MFRERHRYANAIAAAILALVVSLAAVTPAQAGGHTGSGIGNDFVVPISADRAAAIAANATGGRVLKVERKGSVYKVRVLLEGQRVRNVSVDARTGKLR